MKKETLKADLRSTLIDAHAFFYLLKGNEAARLRIWEILPDSIIIDRPKGAPMRRTILGYIPTIDGRGIYEIDGTIETEPLPEQLRDTVRVMLAPEKVRKVNRRLFPRHSFTPPIEVTVRPPKKGYETKGSIINLSAGGIRMETPTKLSPKDEYTFEFKVELDDEVHEITVKGNTVYEIPLKGGFSYGIRFNLAAKSAKKTAEAPIESLDKTVDLLGLVNRLIVRDGM